MRIPVFKQYLEQIQVSLLQGYITTDKTFLSENTPKRVNIDLDFVILTFQTE